MMDRFLRYSLENERKICAVLMQDKNTLAALETAIGCIKAEQQEKARQKHKMFDGMVKEKIW